MKIRMRWSVAVAIALMAGLGAGGCGKSSSGNSGSGESTEKLSPMEDQAQKASLTAISRHWVKGPDGWTTARTAGSAYAPEHF